MVDRVRLGDDVRQLVSLSIAANGRAFDRGRENEEAILDAIGIPPDQIGMVGAKRLVGAMEDFLAVTDRDALMAALDLLGDQSDTAVDAHLMKLILRRGVNPVALRAYENVLPVASATKGGLSIRMDPAIPPVEDSWDSAMVQLAPLTYWTGTALRVPRGSVGATMANALLGEPLQRLIEAPELAAIDARITTVGGDDAPTTIVNTDHVPEMTTWRRFARSASRT